MKKFYKMVAVGLVVLLGIGMLPALGNKVYAAKQTNTNAAISVGYSHNMVIKADCTLYAWGKNDFGQLGDGTWKNKSTPVKIMDDVSFVSAGHNFTMAIKFDGSLWAWGYNERGQLGDGTGETTNTPVHIMDGVASVSAGEYHTLAVKTDGSLWAWGCNGFGGLGDGTKIDRHTPVKTMNGIVSVSAAEHYTMAIKTDGSLWTWGRNYYGQLGDGTKEDRIAPIKIMDGISTVSAGSSYTIVIKTDGSLWAWGWNYYGQLGDGTTESKQTPVKIMDDVNLLDATSVAPMISSVFVNGKKADIDAYNIDGDTYYKLRDIAFVLNGSKKQFDVSWDGANNTIFLLSNTAYTAVDGEMTGKTAEVKTPVRTRVKILLDGKEVILTPYGKEIIIIAYNIDGSNYFSMRDIGQILDFNVSWDWTNSSFLINTSESYVYPSLS